MKASVAARLALTIVASGMLLGCGSATSSSSTIGTAPSPAALTGNWNLLGTHFQQYPFLSLAIIVNGNQITAQGDNGANCPSGSGGGGSIGLSGEIAADGTFTLNEPGNQSSFLWSVTGAAPPAGGSTWAGTYTLTTSPSYSGCTLNQSASFTATALPSFNGTYAGTLFQGSQSSPTATIAVTLNASQGAATATEATGQTYFPLSGTVTVSGISCFTNGTSSTLPGAAVIKGDSVAMVFDMDDGSQIGVTGHYSSPVDSTLSIATVAILSGPCSQTVYAGTLTHQ